MHAPDCPGNEENYGIISEYIGPFGLDGSFDFVLYYAVPSQTFMTDNGGMQTDRLLDPGEPVGVPRRLDHVAVHRE